MSDACQSCGNPEAEHVWVSEIQVTLWTPEPGFKKNSCARRPSEDSAEEAPSLEFKIWSRIDTSLPCPFCGYNSKEEVMNDGERSLECLHCHAQGPYVDPVLEDPIEAWNTRYPGKITISSGDMLSSSNGRGTPVSEMKILKISDD